MIRYVVIAISLLLGQCAFAQSSSVKIWDGSRTASVRSTGSSPSLNCAIVDGSGNQITSFGGAGGTSSTFGSAFPSAGTAGGYSDGTNMQGARVYDTDSGAGTQYTAGCSLRGSASGGSVELATSANPLRVDPTGSTTQPISGSVTANQGGTWNVTNVSGTVSLPTGAATESTLSTLNGKVTACNTGSVTVVSAPTTAVSQSGTWTVQPGNTANTTPWLVSTRPATAGGLTVYRDINLGTTDVAIKASAGQLYGYYIFNAAASTRYVKIYNASTATVVVGTTTPFITLPIPAGGAANVDYSAGIAFSTAITVACTTGIADTDTGAPGANECIGNFYYN